MTIENIKQIIAQGEGINVEFKTCENEISHSVYDSVCAFLNHSGGYILLGVSDKGEILGVNAKKAEDMTRNFINIINDPKVFSPKAYITPSIIDIDNKKIICLPIDKSLYVHKYKGKFFDRNGDADVDVTEQHGLLANLYTRKSSESSENKVIPFLELDDLDTKTFDDCRKLVSLRNESHPWIKMSNEEILKSYGLIAMDPTTGKTGIKQAAILLFGTESSIATFIPSYKIEAIYRNKTHDYFNQNRLEDNTRYDDRITIRANLITAYESLMTFVMKYLPEKFYLEDGTTQRGDLRSNIFREIIANLLVHREYTSPFAGSLEIFSDRVITKNYTRFIPSFKTGSISLDDLESCTKNPLLVKVFRELGWVEELGSGSRNIKKYAPLYFKNSSVEIKNEENFIFSITYRDITIDTESKSVNGDSKGVNTSNRSVNEYSKGVNGGSKGVNGGSKGVNDRDRSVNEEDDKLGTESVVTKEVFLKLVETKATGITKSIKKRMSEELFRIYQVGNIDKATLLEELGYSASQMKADLRVLGQYNFIVFHGKDKSYSLSDSIKESLNNP